eukprot:5686815-Pyramimonas_sp.AAC.1
MGSPSRSSGGTARFMQDIRHFCMEEQSRRHTWRMQLWWQDVKGRQLWPSYCCSDLSFSRSKAAPTFSSAMLWTMWRF